MVLMFISLVKRGRYQSLLSLSHEDTVRGQLGSGHFSLGNEFVSTLMLELPAFRNVRNICFVNLDLGITSLHKCEKYLFCKPIA